MIIGMTGRKAKIAITVDAELVDQVRDRVARGDAASVSAYFQHAVRGQLAAEADFDEALRDIFEATGGPPTARERAAARKVLHGRVS